MKIGSDRLQNIQTMKTMVLNAVSVGVSIFKPPEGKIQTDLWLSTKEEQLYKPHRDLGEKKSFKYIFKYLLKKISKNLLCLIYIKHLLKFSCCLYRQPKCGLNIHGKWISTVLLYSLATKNYRKSEFRAFQGFPSLSQS